MRCSRTCVAVLGAHARARVGTQDSTSSTSFVRAIFSKIGAPSALQKRRVCESVRRKYSDLPLARAAGGWVATWRLVVAKVGASPSKRGRKNP